MNKNFKTKKQTKTFAKCKQGWFMFLIPLKTFVSKNIIHRNHSLKKQTGLICIYIKKHDQSKDLTEKKEKKNPTEYMTQLVLKHRDRSIYSK